MITLINPCFLFLNLWFFDFFFRLKGNLDVRQEELRKLREVNDARNAEFTQLRLEKEQLRTREEEIVTMVAGLEIKVRCYKSVNNEVF